MSGILDNKSRIIDAIVTVEGRRQMAEGTFEVSYVTFSDADVAYLPDVENGHEDPTNKIYLEATNLPQDQITFEANDEGNLVPFRSQDIKLKTPGGNVSSSYSQGSIANGSLIVYQYHHGRRIKTDGIGTDSRDAEKGFIYSDSTGLTGSILMNPNLAAGKYVASGGGFPVAPYTGYVGTLGGLSPQNFALAISGAISQVSSIGGPNFYVEAVNESVYLDGNSGSDIQNLKVFATGTLSTPLTIEEPAIGGQLLLDELIGPNFASQIQGILTSSFDNFVQNTTLSSINRLFKDDNFSLSTNEINFDLSAINPTTLNSLKSVPPSLNSIDSLFNDQKLSHLDNFLYLPPIIKTSDSEVTDKSKVENLTPYLLGDYPSWGDNEKKMTFADVMSYVKKYSTYNPAVVFDETSIQNRVIGQIFEVTDSVVSKLDVVDFGEVMNDVQETTAVTNRVFFVGKTFLDNRGTTCFVNLFTLVFSKDPKLTNEGLMK